MMSTDVIGWDIGGAHLKAVWLDRHGVVHKAIQQPCALWLGIDQLHAAIQHIMADLALPQHDRVSHAVTMTGELVDAFPNRHAGVLAIAQVASAILGSRVQIYAGDHGFISDTHVAMHTPDIASMNWHASAHWVATQQPSGLFVDIGTTTTDLIAFESGAIAMPWRTDAQRLSHHALVYTGVLRTPVMAVVQQVKFKNLHYYVAAEYFATMADVYRLLGQLPTEIDTADTADGQDKSALSCMRRLARMIGHDVEDASEADWHALAQEFAIAQQHLLGQAMIHYPHYQYGIVGVGAGQCLVNQLAEQLGVPYQCAGQWIEAVNPAVQFSTNICFPAYAVAQLLRYGI